MAKSTFVGFINGVKYTDPQEYGAALTGAIQEGKSINATVAIKPVAEEREIGRKCIKGLKPAVTSEFDNKNILNFVDEHDLIPRFDLDALTGDQSHDNDLIDAFMPRLHDEHLREIANFITHNGMVAPKNFKRDYLSLLEEAFYKINEQKTYNAQALSKLHIERAKLQEKEADVQDQIEELQTKLNNIKSEQDSICDKISVCVNADGILKNEAEAYRTIRWLVEAGSKASPQTANRNKSLRPKEELRIDVQARQKEKQQVVDLNGERMGFFRLMRELGIV